MSRSLFSVPTVYLLDTSSLVRLDGLDGIPSAHPFSSKEQKLIWDGLEDLASDKRLKLIKQVKGELKRYNQPGLDRLRKYPGHLLKIDSTDPLVVKLYREVTTNHPDLMKGGSRKDHGDPWLIVASEIYGYTIITEELLKRIVRQHYLWADEKWRESPMYAKQERWRMPFDFATLLYS